MGNVIAISRTHEDQMIEFGEVENITWVKEGVILLARKLSASFEPFLNSYLLKDREIEEYVLISPIELLDFRPLDYCASFEQ